MIFKRHNPTAPLALECALLFLAISVFGWGLQAKLSVYQINEGKSTSASYMAKLATEKSTARTVAAVNDRDQGSAVLELRHIAAVTFSLQSNQFPTVFMGQLEPGPRIPGRYNLHGPDLMRRPPPVLS